MMTNIINFPTPKGNHKIPMEWICHYSADQKEIKYISYEGYMEKQAFSFAEELKEIKAMSLWQRIFNWPY